ncbi:hypothetical protein Y032_0256g377 [Ancylostoma ceylanicum]|uniref:Uncharacterized protein n=1 Tax=Ancylostoma ceylanicum TaxID=53326 RepID=A0A016SBV5_9BILA|nr:hypothetical protein Y032_0256g377 [Ancylostoma ceylanicum]
MITLARVKEGGGGISFGYEGEELNTAKARNAECRKALHKWFPALGGWSAATISLPTTGRRYILPAAMPINRKEA